MLSTGEDQGHQPGCCGKGLWEGPQDRAGEGSDHKLESPGRKAEAKAGAGCWASPRGSAVTEAHGDVCSHVRNSMSSLPSWAALLTQAEYKQDLI